MKYHNMSGSSWITYAVLFNCFAASACVSNTISDRCIECLCEATSSHCNRRSVGCSDGGVCGPLELTKPFWVDGGMFRLKGRTPDDPKAFTECAQNIFCASETIRGYAKKYSRDCDGNGIFDCEDYMRIHRLGPHACSDSSFENSEFYRRAKACL